MKLPGIFTTAVVSTFFAVSVHAAPTLTLRTGATSVALEPALVTALTTLGVTPDAIKPSVIRRGVIKFPIPEGRLDQANLKGEILHLGGLRLSTATKVVELTQYVIDTTGATPVLTGLVIVDGSVVGRLPLYNLSVPAVTLPLPAVRRVRLSGVELTLHPQAATALNGAFGVTAFAGGFKIGTGTVTASTRQSSRVR
jgi:hypothetical protein